MNFSRHISVLLLSASSIFSANVFSQTVAESANQLLYGTWVLDVSRSVFIEREAPKAQTMTFAPNDGGLETTIVITNKNGAEDRISYVDKQNGEPAQLSGSTNFDTVVMESHDPYHVTSILSHAGMEVGRSQRTISLNGREMIVEVERKGNLSSRSLFVKQP